MRDGYSISGSAEVPEPDEPLQVDPDSSGFTSCPSSLLPSESSQPHTNSTRGQTIPADSPECAGQFLRSKQNNEQDASSSLKSLLEGLPANTRRPKLASSAGDLVEALPDRHADHAHNSEITSSEEALSNDDHLRRIVSLIQVAKDTPRRPCPHAAAQINKTLPLHKGTAISRQGCANTTRVKDAAASECDQCADEGARVDNSAGGENGGEEEESDWSNLVLLKHVAGDRLSLYNHLANIPLESTTSETDKEDERIDTADKKSRQDICNAGKRAHEATSVATRSSRPLDASYQTLRHKTQELLES